MKFSNILLAILIMSLSWACYDNKGSDSYVEKLGIRVEGIDQLMKVNIGEQLKIEPKIYPEDREYRCFWGVAGKGNQWAVIDTLSHDRNLDVKINLKTGTYVLRYYAEDVETGIFSYTEYDLSVETDIATGWWVLKSDAQGTDVDHFNGKQKKENIIADANGRNLPGQAVDMSFILNYPYFDEQAQKTTKMRAVVLASEDDIVCVDLYTGGFFREFAELFPATPDFKKVEYLFPGSNSTHVVLDGEMYTMPNINQYTQFAIKHTGDYKISRYRNCSGWGFPLLFDEAASSFCMVTRDKLGLDYLGNNSSTSPHRDLNMDILFIGGRTVNSNGDEAYAILKHKQENLYQLAHLKGAPQAGKSPVLEAMKPLDASKGVVSATWRAMNQDNNIIYYVKDGKVYSYNLDTEKEAEQMTLPAGEEVTFMEYSKYNPWGLNDSWFNYLVIATAKGGSYKVSLHPISAGKIQPAETVMEGKGSVKRVLYIDTTPKGTYTSTCLQ